MLLEDEQEPRPAAGSGRQVNNFRPFCEGDFHPTLNKKIRILIDCATDYLVYLDDDLCVEWTFNGTAPGGFEDVANRIGRLETLAITQLLPLQRELFERLLAESMARIIGDRNEEKAKAILDEAEEYLKARGSENARRWYLGGVGWVALFALVVAGALLLRLSGLPAPWRDVLRPFQRYSRRCIRSLFYRWQAEPKLLPLKPPQGLKYINLRVGLEVRLVSQRRYL